MAQPLPDNDFRARRWKFDPDDFAYAPGPEPEPTDLISEDDWNSIVSLPTDVSLRTSEHHGTVLNQANRLWGLWVSLVLDVQSLSSEPRDDPLSLSCLNTTDDLQASISNVVSGFYRQSIGGLRTSLESLIAASYFHLIEPAGFEKWADGFPEGRRKFGTMCGKLSSSQEFSEIEKLSASKAGNLLGKDGWARMLYRDLSEFAHGRPFFINFAGNKIPAANVGLWGGSNGPVYELRAFRLWYVYFFDAYLLFLVLVALANPGILQIKHPTESSMTEMLELAKKFHPSPRQESVRILNYLFRT